MKVEKGAIINMVSKIRKVASIIKCKYKCRRQVSRAQTDLMKLDNRILRDIGIYDRDEIKSRVRRNFKCDHELTNYL